MITLKFQEDIINCVIPNNIINDHLGMYDIELLALSINIKTLVIFVLDIFLYSCEGLSPKMLIKCCV
jgi:hypothetical protein